MKKQLCTMLCTAALLCSITCPVSAGTADAPMPLASAAVYPAEIRSYARQKVLYLEKVYYLTPQDDPNSIPTDSFELDGTNYTLFELLKNDLSETDTREYTKTLTLDSKTKDVNAIIKTLDPELSVTTEDGYSGVLKPDESSISVAASGYKTSQQTITAARTYPNLSDADVSLIPKTTEHNDHTLTLEDVDWEETTANQTGDYAEDFRFTAYAIYTGTAVSKKATGYTVTVDYAGEISKTSCDTVMYTAVFSGSEITPPQNPGEVEDESNPFPYQTLWIPLGFLALGGAGYGGYKGFKHYQNKKRGYE